MSQLDPSQAQLAQLDDAIDDWTRRLEEARSDHHLGEGNRRKEREQDEELAKAIFVEELEAQLLLLKDAKVAHSIAIAVDNDAELYFQALRMKRVRRMIATWPSAWQPMIRRLRSPRRE